MKNRENSLESIFRSPSHHVISQITKNVIPVVVGMKKIGEGMMMMLQESGVGEKRLKMKSSEEKLIICCAILNFPA